jgi:hypothetical protein
VKKASPQRKDISHQTQLEGQNAPAANNYLDATGEARMKENKLSPSR